MTAIWRNDGSGWKALEPSGFPLEAALHTLVEQAPQMLPLSGDPRLVVVGREVSFGTGFADLVAVEASGRVVIIEVKLAQNAEARRAVVAQILAYAAYAKGIDPNEFDEVLLARHLRERGYSSLIDAMQANDQEGSFDAEAFTSGLAESLATGRFRLVLVLDHAPVELIRRVGYLESMTDGLVIDLVTVATYDVNGTQILVPQRVDPEFQPPPATPSGASSRARSKGDLVEGAARFAEEIARATASEQPRLRRLHDWAVQLEVEGLVKLSTFVGAETEIVTLLPRLVPDRVGLVTIWNERGRAYLVLWRSVFERRAPHSIALVEPLISPKTLGQGTTVHDVSDALLEALTAAYREAVLGDQPSVPAAPER